MQQLTGLRTLIGQLLHSKSCFPRQSKRSFAGYKFPICSIRQPLGECPSIQVHDVLLIRTGQSLCHCVKNAIVVDVFEISNLVHIPAYATFDCPVRRSPSYESVAELLSLSRVVIERPQTILVLHLDLTHCEGRLIFHGLNLLEQQPSARSKDLRHVLDGSFRGEPP